MSEHEPCIGATDEWYTPPEIFDGLGLTFDLDPCSSGRDVVPASFRYRIEDDGLTRAWFGIVWMNPPFGGRNGHVPWLRKFMAHGNGIACVAARTSAAWFHDLAVQADFMLFPRGKTKFLRPDGTRGKSPGTGIVLLSKGETCNEALRKSTLGYVSRPA